MKILSGFISFLKNNFCTCAKKYFFLFGIIGSVYAAPPVWKLSYTLHGRGAIAAHFIDIDTLIIAGGTVTPFDSLNCVIKYQDRGETLIRYYDYGDIIPWFTDMSFPSHDIGYAIGWDGQYLRTIDAANTWIRTLLPSAVMHRHYNGIFFINNNEGYAVGGNVGLQTIIKTTDGGINWTILRDTSGTWLRSVYFISSTTGFCTGDKGTILKTINGGASWTTIASGLANSRQLNRIIFVNASTGFIVGGNPDPNGAQTILKTTNGGDNWNVVIDTAGRPILNAIDFIRSDTGYAVGDKAEIKYTEDGGNHWSNIILPDSIVDTLYNLRTVDFFNQYGGAIGADFGKIILYEAELPLPPLKPEVETGDAITYTNNKANLSGLVNAHNNATQAYFEYGQTLSFGNSIQVAGEFYDSVAHPVSVLTPALGSGIYYYRIRGGNSGGTDTGVTRQFYVGPNTIPNFDFEFWRNDTILSINKWLYSGVVSEGVSYNGSASIVIQNDLTKHSEKTGVLILGLIDKGVSGGAPFAVKADSIAFFARYDFKPGFPGDVFIILKKNAVLLDTMVFLLTGNSNGQFNRLSFPFIYQTTVTPDSIILAFLNNDPLVYNTSSDSNYLEIDDISFPGTLVNVPNHDFEDVSKMHVDRLVSWYVPVFDSVSKTTYAASGLFAARLKSNGLYAGYVSSVTDVNGGPAFPVAERFDTLYANMKYEPVAGDSAMVLINMYKNGLQMGQTSFFHDGYDSAYRKFAIPVNYYNTDIPDSASIAIIASVEHTGTYGSVLYVDHLSFAADAVDSVLLSTHVLYIPQFRVKLFPNPAHDLLNIEITSEKNETVRLNILSIDGKYADEKRLMISKGNTIWKEDMSLLNKGMYIVRLTRDDGSIAVSKLVKE